MLATNGAVCGDCANGLGERDGSLLSFGLGGRGGGEGTLFGFGGRAGKGFGSGGGGVDLSTLLSIVELGVLLSGGTW